jgi:DNA-binding CsgD family transcriptional regulator
MDIETGLNVSTSIPTSPKSKNFFGLLIDLLIQEVNELFFQRVLDLSISAIPIAQAGSMMVLRGEHYHFVAANGYNLQELQKITLSLDESILLAEPNRNSFLLHNLDSFNEIRLDAERQQVLQIAGRVAEIRETLVIPVWQQEQIIATLSLDNFDYVSAFTRENIETGEQLGVVLGLGLRLQNYQEQVAEFGKTKPLNEQSPDGLEVPLCPRDVDILNCIYEGLSDKQIARKLGLQFSTTRNYVRRLYERLGVNSRTQAMRWCEKNKIKMNEG